MKENYTKVLLPKGEWLEAMLTAFNNVNMPLESLPRSYEYSFVDDKLPITFYAVRTKEILGTIYDYETMVYAGFTGTDIALEQGFEINNLNWEFPLNKLNPQAPNPIIYLGITPNLQKKEGAIFDIADLARTTVYTEYPTLTNRFFNEAQLIVNIKAIQGGSEGRWKFDPNNGAVVTVRSTDNTLKANQIEPVIDILKAGVIFVASQDLQNQDKLRIDDLQELLYSKI